MDKKKLIGTIIGVIAFAALIAGATYAWFSFALNVTTGSYSANTQNFIVTYTKGTNITSAPPVLSTPTASGASSLVVSAYRTSDVATGTLSIKLTTTSTDALTTSGVVRWAVCSSTSSSNSGCTSLASGQTGVKATGSVTAASTITLYSEAIPTTQTYYYVYFWLDGATYGDAHINKTYSGYIHASATQN